MPVVTNYGDFAEACERQRCASPKRKPRTPSPTNEREPERQPEPQQVKQDTPRRRIWHWGHKSSVDHSNSLRENKCLIGHHEWQLDEVGLNTHRQFLVFENRVQEGDIIFLHCSKKGGLTHWGKYISEGREDKTGPSDIPGKQWTDTTIRVDEWRELAEPLKGSGRNSTLYEVKSNTKNYDNYIVKDKKHPENKKTKKNFYVLLNKFDLFKSS